MNDLPHVTCERVRDAISAAIDGEERGIEERLVAAHLVHCSGCREYGRLARAMPRVGAVGTAPDMPDLSRRVTKLAALADRANAWGAARILLAVAALQIVALSIPYLTATGKSGNAAHDSRHLGAFTIAYGVALLVVVVRPARARTVLPVACVLAGALVITAGIDLAIGNVPFLGEALHLPELLSVLLVWVLARPSRRQPTPHRRTDAAHLTLVDDTKRHVG